MQETAQTYYNQNSQPKVKYSLSVTKEYLEKLVGTGGAIVNVFTPGDYLPIKDDDIGVDKSVRIKSFTRNLLDEYDYKLTISDTVTTNITNRVISELIDIDNILTINNLKDPIRAKANWRTSRELLDMVFDADGDYYTEKIKPLSIDTQLLSVGAKSMQFGLTNTVFQPNYNGNANSMRWQGGVLTHYTIIEDGVRSWAMADGSVTFSQNVPYYLYAKCPKADGATGGTFLFSTEQIKVEDDANYWHFLIGTVSSIDPDLGVRSLSLTYGFTMVNGRFIKTGRIQSADGDTYFDLDNGEIGGRIVFSSNGQEKTLEQLGAESLETKNYINNTLPGILSEIQAQLDGQIEQFFDTYDPTTANLPASSWTTTTDKENHLGDLFYNTNTGKVFRWVKENGVYKWQELQDSEVAQALAIANDALALAGTKRRIFTSTPYTPYDVGDLWVQGASGDIMKCKTARASGNYTASDWEKASKYTDNSAFNAFVNGTYADDIENLVNQIDGKIESWFQTSDPATAWTTAAIKAKHVGDMWFNSSTNTLKRYSSSYAWVDIHDQKAIDAYNNAATAQDTADGKRRVFVTTPYPPYDIGDLWVNGTDLRRCATARASGSYQVNDWVLAVTYDNTKTVIDGGLVTSGTIQVAGSNASILAGMTGQGTAASSIRFWAGASFENRATAPFRVRQDGKVIMTNAEVSGKINASSGEIGGFSIGQGRIGVNGSGDQYAGLSIYNDAIYIRDLSMETKVYAGVGNTIPASTGVKGAGRFEMVNETDYGDGGIALLAKYLLSNTALANNMDLWYRPLAFERMGNELAIGKKSEYDIGFIGMAYTDTLEEQFKITHTFMFTGIASSYMSMYLPSATLVNNALSNRVVTFRIRIIVSASASNKIALLPPRRSSSDNTAVGSIYRAGSTASKIDLDKQDTIELQYYMGNWYVVSQNWNY